MVLHKLLYTVDNIFIKTEKQLSEKTPENNLLSMKFGKYKLLNINAYHAFIKLKIMRNQNVDVRSSKEGLETEKSTTTMLVVSNITTTTIPTTIKNIRLRKRKRTQEEHK